MSQAHDTWIDDLEKTPCDNDCIIMEGDYVKLLDGGTMGYLRVVDADRYGNVVLQNGQLIYSAAENIVDIVSEQVYNARIKELGLN